MRRAVAFYTYLFQIEEVKLCLINNNYWVGESLANWLIDKLEKGEFSFGKPHQEHWGWSFEAKKGGEKYFVSIWGMDQLIEEGNAEWEVMIEKKGHGYHSKNKIFQLLKKSVRKSIKF